MRKGASKKKRDVPASKKALKSPIKAIRKIIKKITTSGKKTALRPRVALKPRPKEKLVIKKTFTKITGSFDTPSAAPARDNKLPPYYGEDKLVLMVRDPWWLFAYWEVTPGREAYIRDQVLRSGFTPDKTVLRVYDVSNASIESPASFFDIEIDHLNSNWYIDVGQPNRVWVAEIGIRAHGGRFFAMVRSNAVKTPPFGISDILDEEWMMPDEMYFKLVGVMGGFDKAGDSMEMRKLFERYIRQAVSSEASPRLSKTGPPAPPNS